jgi:hypothetical protein
MAKTYRECAAMSDDEDVELSETSQELSWPSWVIV